MKSVRHYVSKKIAQLVSVACNLEDVLEDIEFRKEMMGRLQDEELLKLKKKFVEERERILDSYEVFRDEVRGKVGSSYAIDLKKLQDKARMDFDLLGDEFNRKVRHIQDEIEKMQTEVNLMWTDDDCGNEETKMSQFAENARYRLENLRNELREHREKLENHRESFTDFLHSQREKAKHVTDDMVTAKRIQEDEIMAIKEKIARPNVAIKTQEPNDTQLSLLKVVRDGYLSWNELTSSRVAVTRMFNDIIEEQEIQENIRSMIREISSSVSELNIEYEKEKERAKTKIQSLEIRLSNDYAIMQRFLEVRHQIKMDIFHLELSHGETPQVPEDPPSEEMNHTINSLQSQIQELKLTNNFLNAQRSELNAITRKYDSTLAKYTELLDSISHDMEHSLQTYDRAKSQMSHAMVEAETSFRRDMHALLEHQKNLPNLYSVVHIDQEHQKNLAELAITHSNNMDKIMEELEKLKFEVIGGNSKMKEASQTIFSRNQVELMSLGEFCKSQIEKHRSELLGMRGFYDEKVEVLMKQRDILRSTIEETARPEEAEQIVDLRKQLKTLNKKYTNLLLQLSDLAPEVARSYPPAAFEETKRASRPQLITRKTLIRRPR